MTSNLKIDYIEFSSPKLEITQDFFAKPETASVNARTVKIHSTEIR